MPEVLILTGPPGAGKSSVAQALAGRYDRVAHIDVDTLRHFITPTGYAASGKPGFDRQHALAIRNACDLARNFLDDRVAVIIEDVLPMEAELARYTEGLRPLGSAIHCVLLLPSFAACLERNAGRKEGRVTEDWVKREYERFSTGEPGWLTIDSTDMTVEATADRVQAATTSGESLILASTVT